MYIHHVKRMETAAFKKVSRKCKRIEKGIYGFIEGLRLHTVITGTACSLLSYKGLILIRLRHLCGFRLLVFNYCRFLLQKITFSLYISHFLCHFYKLQLIFTMSYMSFHHRVPITYSIRTLYTQILCIQNVSKVKSCNLLNQQVCGIS